MVSQCRPNFAAQVVKSLFLAGFLLFVAIGLVLDLGLGRSGSASGMTLKQSARRTLIWISAGLLFAIPLYYLHHHLHQLHTAADFAEFKRLYGSSFTLFSDAEKCRDAFARESVIQYITGYFVEYSLSVDNLFVMMLIFGAFRVKQEDQKRILIWGVVGAVIMRFLFIFLGGMLIREFHWILYVFGAFLLFSGFRLLIKKEEDEHIDTGNHPMVRLVSRFFRVTTQDPNGKFFIRQHGRSYATALFVVLIVVEFTDVIFAVDSVPAIFGITRDPYIVFFSNIFAIMGLRSLFFLLGHSMKKMSTLQYGLSLILIFIGGKMLLEEKLKAVGFTAVHSLMVLAGILLLTYVSSFLLPRKKLD